MRKSRMMTRSLTTAFLLSLLLATGAWAQMPGDLVVTRPGVPVRSPQGQAATYVDIDHSLLRSRTPSLRIELPDGLVEIVDLDGFERRSRGDLTWRGRVRFQPESRVVLTLKRGFVMGTLHTAQGTYELRPARGGGQMIEKLDMDSFGECNPNRPVPTTDSTLEPLTRSIETSPGSFEASLNSSESADQIKVMALYTPEARDAAGGTNQIEALIQAAVDASNTAFADSDMAARFTLVHSGLAAHSDTGDIDADLEWLRGDGGVAALRNQYGADMVSLMITTSPYCGSGYVMRTPGADFEAWAFQVTHRACAVSNLSFAHEHGHNMGFEHDPANGVNPNSASYEWAYGHFVDGSYRTVMAYSSECNLGCSRVPRFSNPSVSYNGQATGLPGTRDNAQTGESTASIVANFRTSATCGNGVREGTEECDGDDLGGASCDAVGCTGGSPICTASCTVDYTACSSCGTCDFDGVCETGENCGNCASDCSSGSGATCGNGICEAADGEDCLSCPSDCNGQTGGRKADRFCCGDGDGPNPIGVEDSRCTTGGFQCTDIAAVGSCCGDGACTGFEDGSTCGLDCGAAPSCGDGICDPGESSCSCDLDCGPPPTTEWLTCTDGVDNDCDGLTDCADGDCADDAACGLSCEPLGASCSSNGDCCSGSCRGPRNRRTCK